MLEFYIRKWEETGDDNYKKMILDIDPDYKFETPEPKGVDKYLEESCFD